MKPHIIEKIEKHIALPMDTECKAVYFLVELRKLLDMDEQNRNNYSILRTMSNWSCHIDLNTDKGSKNIIRQLESSIPKFLKKETEDDGYEELVTIFQEFLFSFETRRKMKEFLCSHQLPTTLCDNTEYWLSFIKSYVGVITDGAIINNTGRSNPRLVEWVIFKCGHPVGEGFPRINVEVTLVDERVLSANLHAKINEDNRLQWEMHGPTIK